MARQTRGFTFNDVLAIAAIVPILLSLGMGSLNRARESANRVKCASNLSQIGRAMLIYSNVNKGMFPRTTWDKATATNPTQYTGVNAPYPFGPGAPAPNDVTAAMFLLIRTQDIGAEVFICPSDEKDPWKFDGKSPMQVSNFPSEKYLSYSMGNPYPAAPAVQTGYKWVQGLSPEFAIAADMNPGSSALTTLTVNSPRTQIQQGNSQNHEGRGQNVLYGDGHVEWNQTPFCGVKRDCIYTVAADPMSQNGPTVVGSPSWAGDSVLLPVASMQRGAAGSNVFLIVSIVGIVLLAGIGVLLFVLLRKKPQPAGAMMPGMAPPQAMYPAPGAPIQTPSGNRPPPLPPRQ